jgi:beta-glucosidase
VAASVTNTGARPGVAVPQLYVGLPSPGPGVVQPPRQLRGYTKVVLKPGETRRVAFALDARALSYWDTGAGGWRLAPGCYRVMVGSSSRDLPLSASACDVVSARP